MAAVKRRDTGPELALRRELHHLGVRGWRCDYRGAPGRPDLAWPALKVAIFVDGAFWHGHQSRHRPGRSGSYWDKKIAANVARDRRVDAELRERGWQSIRIWDFEIARDLEGTTTRIRELLKDRLLDRGPTSRWHYHLLSYPQNAQRISEN